MRFRNLILERSGLYFPEKKKMDLEIGLAKALSEANIGLAEPYNLEQYYRLLQDKHHPVGRAEMERLVNALTVGETHFFRNEAQFDALYTEVLPALIAHKRAAAAAVGPGILPQLRIWSAGCATGEEPYSLAIMLTEMIPDLKNWHILILATDINRDSLAQAKAATYSSWSFRETRAKSLRDRYFTWETQLRRYRLRADISSMVTFAPLNLIEDIYPSIHNNTISMDLIFCRNVTIYFNEENTHQVVNRFYRCLVEGGWLVVGHSEPSLVVYRAFEAVNVSGAVLYKKTSQTTPWPDDWQWLEGGRQDGAQHEGGGYRQNGVQYEQHYEDTKHHELQAGAGWSLMQAPGRPNGQVKKMLASPMEAISRQVQPVSNQNDKIKPDWVSLKSTEEIEQRVSSDNTSQILRGIREPAELDPCTSASLLLNDGAPEQAIEMLQNKLSAIPNSALAHSLLGRAYANLGQWEEARRWCNRALRLDTLNAETYYVLALVYEQENESDLAIDSLKKAIYLDRNMPLYHFNLAMLHKKRGQINLARRSLRNTIRILEEWPAACIVPDTGGATAKHLLDAVRRVLKGLE
jgi:chemotaxis protein methyltransferase CheR